MKYIRTSNGRIYETTGQDKKHPRYYNIANTNLEIDALGIVNQADTIEELCDAFVCDRFVHNNLKELLEFGELGRFIGGTIYGAIWTDKGLIYVAKMNDKGELELL